MPNFKPGGPLVAQTSKKRKLEDQDQNNNEDAMDAEGDDKNRPHKKARRDDARILGMHAPAQLSDPTPRVASLPSISGRAGTEEPLTAATYELIKERRRKAETSKDAAKSWKSSAVKTVKLGYLQERAYFPRVLAVKLADLTAGYRDQLDSLMMARAKYQADDLAAPELEGNFEKSRDAAERFQNAMEDIEQVFRHLREKSKQVVNKMVNSIVESELAPAAQLELRNALKTKYSLSGSDGKLEAEHTLLPLLKGKNVYERKMETFEHLLSHATKDNNSTQLATAAETQNGTWIHVKHHVQPKYESWVFSDHAGFVVAFSHPECRPLHVYYQSLEHGYQHTATRTASTPGSHSALYVTKGVGENAEFIAVTEPRMAYVWNLDRGGLLEKLKSEADKANADLILIVGECPRSIDKEIVKITGNRLVHQINASGCGVHALMAYILRAPNQKADYTLAPYHLKKSGIDQNLLTLEYGPEREGEREKHAFVHLLNDKEKDIVNELADVRFGYASVSGDLNKLPADIGLHLFETLDHRGTYVTTGSNSTSTKWYDKVVVLSPVPFQMSTSTLRRSSRRAKTPPKKSDEFDPMNVVHDE